MPSTSKQPKNISGSLPVLDNPKPTADHLVAEYIRIKDYLTQEAKRFADFCAPYKAKQDEIEGQLMEMLNALGGDGRQALKTDHGTCYKSTIVTPKIVDRDKYLDAVLDNWDTFGSGMLQIGPPKKESIDEFMQSNNGALPPGVDVSSFVRVNIRRT